MRKIQGKEVVTADSDETSNNVIDLMEALQRSVKLSKQNSESETA